MVTITAIAIQFCAIAFFFFAHMLLWRIKVRAIVCINKHAVIADLAALTQG